MREKNKQRFFIQTAILCFGLFYGEASLAGRVAQIDASGYNSTTNTDSLEAVTSSYIITVSNPSNSTSQSYALSVVGICAAGSVACVADVQATADASNSYTINTTYTIAAGVSHTYIFNFPAFTAATVGYQQLYISGSIQVSNTSATAPGFLTASGSLTTYTQTIRAGDLGGGAPYMKGTMMPSQTEIVIGEGRPF